MRNTHKTALHGFFFFMLLQREQLTIYTVYFFFPFSFNICTRDISSWLSPPRVFPYPHNTRTFNHVTARQSSIKKWLAAGRLSQVRASRMWKRKHFRTAEHLPFFTSSAHHRKQLDTWIGTCGFSLNNTWTFRTWQKVFTRTSIFKYTQKKHIHTQSMFGVGEKKRQNDNTRGSTSYPRFVLSPQTMPT